MKAECECSIAANEVPQCRLERFALPLLASNVKMQSVAMVAALNAIMRS
jgi:hypothetical protein